MSGPNPKIDLWHGLNEEWLHQLFDYESISIDLFEEGLWWWRRLGSKTDWKEVPRFWKSETWNDFNGFNLKFQLNSDPKVLAQSLKGMLTNEVRHRAGLACRVPSFAHYRFTIGTEVKIPAMELPLAWTEKQAVEFFKKAYRKARVEAGYEKVSNAKSSLMKPYFDAIETFDRRFHLGQSVEKIGHRRWRQHSEALRQIAEGPHDV